MKILWLILVYYEILLLLAYGYEILTGNYRFRTKVFKYDVQELQKRKEVKPNNCVNNLNSQTDLKTILFFQYSLKCLNQEK